MSQGDELPVLSLEGDTVFRGESYFAENDFVDTGEGRSDNPSVKCEKRLSRGKKLPLEMVLSLDISIYD